MENEYIFRPKQINYLKFDANLGSDSQRRIVDLVSAATGPTIENGTVTKIIVRPMADDKYGIFLKIRRRNGKKIKLFCNQEFTTLEMNFSIDDSEHSSSEVCPPIVKINLKEDRIHILDPSKNHNRPTILYRYV